MLSTVRGSALRASRTISLNTPCISQALFHSTPIHTNRTAGKSLAGTMAYDPADFAKGTQKEKKKKSVAIYTL